MKRLPLVASSLLLTALSAQAEPVPSWTGFYVGAQIGGAWADRDVGYAANDQASALLVGGAVPIASNQPLAPFGFSETAVTGGVEIGHNWQIGRTWIVGLEADFSLSGLKGSGSGTSILTVVPPVFPQTVSAEQSIEWWGTIRGRLGWLATPNLLLYGTAGLAYGSVASSTSYLFSGLSGANFGLDFIGSGSFACVVNVVCFAGSRRSVEFGWTVGGGGEWRLSRGWSLKAEYLYVNLGPQSVTATARVPNAAALPGTPLSSFNVNLGSADFHVARLGLNFHF